MNREKTTPTATNLDPLQGFDHAVQQKGDDHAGDNRSDHVPDGQNHTDPEDENQGQNDHLGVGKMVVEPLFDDVHGLYFPFMDTIS
jgi:hypothetical protein